MDNMNFSFLMAVHEKTPYLDEAIKSVLNQTDNNFYFYIIANNCTNELWYYLSCFQDKRIKLFRTQIGQLAFNLNYGLNLIKTGYVLRMDADDISLPERLANTKLALQKENYPDILNGEAIIINPKEKQIGYRSTPVTHKEIVSSLWYKNPIIHPACALSVKTIIQLGGYQGGQQSEDIDLWLRAAKKNAVFAGTTVPMIKYRQHSTQSQGSRLSYAETTSHLLREFLKEKKTKYLLGTLVGCMKTFFKSQ